MNAIRVEAIDHADRTARLWVTGVAMEFGTGDKQFAYRVLGAWMHTVRDRLSVEAAAQFATELPELVRGVYYAGWDPNRVPEEAGADVYSRRFAREAKVSLDDVPQVVATVTRAVDKLTSPGHVPHALDQLPQSVRSVLT